MVLKIQGSGRIVLPEVAYAMLRRVRKYSYSNKRLYHQVYYARNKKKNNEY
jgi:hypothetical protein